MKSFKLTSTLRHTNPRQVQETLAKAAGNTIVSVHTTDAEFPIAYRLPSTDPKILRIAAFTNPHKPNHHRPDRTAFGVSGKGSWRTYDIEKRFVTSMEIMS